MMSACPPWLGRPAHPLADGAEPLRMHRSGAATAPRPHGQDAGHGAAHGAPHQPPEPAPDTRRADGPRPRRAAAAPAPAPAFKVRVGIVISMLP